MRLKYIEELNTDGKDVASWIAKLLNEKLDGFVIGGVRWLKGKEREHVIAEFDATLRSMVDQWIDSGRVDLATLGERPWERDITWRSKKYPTTLFEVVYRFWKRNPVRMEIELRGENALVAGPKTNLQRSNDPAFMAREYAIFEFERFRNSKSPERLSRCDGCGTYYVHARTPKVGKAIFHGTFCADCKNKGGAIRTRKSRNDRTQEMIAFASEIWPKWRKSNRLSPQRVWIAEQVNNKFGTSVTKNWVSHHMPKILEREEALQYAKG